VCTECGRYRSRVVIDMAAKLEKKHAKMKARDKARSEEATKEPEEVVEDRPLDAAELSKK